MFYGEKDSPHNFVRIYLKGVCTLDPVSKYIVANGLKQHYLDWGNSDAQTVLMTHGIGLCAQIWNNAARSLASDYHVLSLDLRAHGDTDDPGKDYEFFKMGEDIAAFIRELGINGAWGVGHSAGGMSLLISDHVVPGQLEKIMLIDTRVGDGPMSRLSPEERAERLKRTGQKRMIWETQEIMYEAYRNRRVFQTWTDEVFSDYIYGGTRVLDDGTAQIKCSNLVEATFYETRNLMDTSQVLRGLGARYMLAVGNYEGNQKTTDKAVQTLSKEAREFQFYQFPEGSHFVPMEHPNLVLAQIRSYLDW